MELEMIDVCGIIELQERTQRAAAYIIKKAGERELRTVKRTQVKAWLVAGLAANIIGILLLRGF